MGANSNIEWTDHTFNPWIGCAKVSPGCKFCYAENLMDTRYGRVEWGVNGTRVRTSAANWKKPLQWDREAKAAGVRRRVFCASLADVFEDREDLVQLRTDLFLLIDATPNLDWLLLTKRPENIQRMWRELNGSGWLDDKRYNVWLGTSVENQEAADERIPHLLAAAHLSRFTFLSCEPLLGPVDLWGARYKKPDGSRTGAVSRAWPPHVDWVIVGGESGHNARPMHSMWAKIIRDDCAAAGVPFLFKQWGEWMNGSSQADGVVVFNDGGTCPWNKEAAETEARERGWQGRDPHIMSKVGKHRAGRLLEGVEHNAFPV